MESPLDAISEGDRAAKGGDWSTAVAVWRRAIATGDPRGYQRIAWFLDESEAPATHRRSVPWATAACSTGLALAGTSFVLFAERLDGLSRTLLVILAWTAFVLAAIVVVRLAHAIGNLGQPTGRNLTEADLDRAQARGDAMTRSWKPTHLESPNVRR